MATEGGKTLTMPQAVLASGILIAIAIFGSGFIKQSEIPTSPEMVQQEGGSEAVDELALLSNVLPIEEGVDHVRGSEDPSFIVYEYSDMDCPFCGRFHDTMKRLVEEYPEVAWVYRHLPLDGLHPDARAKAMAAECAFQQGGDDAFWALTDYIFAANPSLAEIPAVLEGYGLDVDTYGACIENELTAERVDRDVVNAIQTLGGTDRLSTPWSIMQLPNGILVPIRGAQPYEALVAIIESELNN